MGKKKPAADEKNVAVAPAATGGAAKSGGDSKNGNKPKPATPATVASGNAAAVSRTPWWAFVANVYVWLLIGCGWRFIFAAPLVKSLAISLAVGVVFASIRVWIVSTPGLKVESPEGFKHFGAIVLFAVSAAWAGITIGTSKEFAYKLRVLFVQITTGEVNARGLLGAFNPYAWPLITVLGLVFFVMQFTHHAKLKASGALYSVRRAFGSSAVSGSLTRDAAETKENPRIAKVIGLPTLILMFVTFVAVAVGNSYRDYVHRSCPLELGKEYPPAGFYDNSGPQSSLVTAITDTVKAAAKPGFDNVKPTEARRAVHHNSRGCVKGSFQVDKRLSKRMRIGTFDEGAAYPAWIRFSSASSSVQPDSESDVRGMAVKLIGVADSNPWNASLATSEGGFVAQTGRGSRTHDLLSISAPFFPVSDPSSYEEFMRATISKEQTLAMVKYVFPSLNPCRWRLRFFAKLILLGKMGRVDKTDASTLTLQAFMNKLYEGLDWIAGLGRTVPAITNPLSTQYWSTTAYSYGGIPNRPAVKFSWKPCAVSDKRAATNERLTKKYPSNFLRETMRNQLESEDACFELLIQEQTQPCVDPVEDPSVVWAGPYVRVGVLTIPKQQFLSHAQDDFCQNLQFSPWNAPAAHRPLGAINHARKATYEAGARLRHSMNGVTYAEPTGAETFPGRQLSLPREGAGDVYRFQYLTYDDPTPLLPRKIRDFHLIPELDFTDEKFGRMKAAVSVDVKDFNANIFKPNGKPFSAFDTPEDYILLLKNETWKKTFEPAWKMSHHWQADSEFARSYLSGVNPVAIIDPFGLDKKLPAIFQPNAEEAARIAAVADGQTLQQLMDSHKLFYADYEILKDIDMTQGRVFYAPVVLFFVKTQLSGRRHLMPLAIQLTRSTNQHNQIFTPPAAGYDPYSGDGLVWLFARMHATSADAQVHEMVSHLLYTHLAMEPVIIAFHRQFPKDHPLLNLMLPHFVDTLAINNLGRNTLLADASKSYFEHVSTVGIRGSTQLMETVYQKIWSFRGARPEHEMAARGFKRSEPNADHSKDALPDYLYKDYAFLVWDAMHDFVAEIVNTLYATDDAVANEPTIQGLINELYDPDLGGVPYDDSNPARARDVLNTKAALVDFITGIMFSCSAQHSAVNFGQADYYAFVPARPFHLNRPMPDDVRQVDMRYVMSSLPVLEYAQETIMIATTLVVKEPTGLLDDVKQFAGLFAYRKSPFGKASAAFLNSLTRIEAIIAARNAAVSEAHFPYLLPSQIMPSISI